MDQNFLTIIGTALVFLALVYAILINIKMDIKNKIYAFEGRIICIEERIFFLASRKTLLQAIKDQKLKDGKK